MSKLSLSVTSPEFLGEVFLTVPAAMLFSIGFTGITASWAIGNGLIGGIGFLFIIASIACGIYNLCFNTEKIILNLIKREQTAKEKEENQKLNALMADISRKRRVANKFTSNKRVSDIFKELLDVRNAFSQLSKNKEFDGILDHQTVEKFNFLFWVTIQQLDRSNRILDICEKVKDNSSLLAQREVILQKVENSLKTLQSTYEKIQQIFISQNDIAIESVQSDLDATMKIAEEVDREMAEFKDFSDYRQVFE